MLSITCRVTNYKKMSYMLCFAYNNFFFSDSPSRFKFFSLVISQWMGLWDKDWRWGGGVLRNNFQRQSLGGEYTVSSKN